ncbi:Outer envelope pore protein 24, chloroplastic [Glycine soja]|uniref:Outer envelope pore protein 24, chloroplastic n=1 Tax=Glycine soja TaxID=3848 RepID=A0A0B2RQH0_GLYSO|nr:Outer envelope pore protein 24, chloroplastic [Glycine soja]
MKATLKGKYDVDKNGAAFANIAVNAGDVKFRASGLTTFEPAYDVAKNTWDFAVSRRVYGGDDTLRASYQTSSRVLGVEWSRNPKHTAGFKVNEFTNECQCLVASCG